LITAINDANKGMGHNTLILEENCVYEITAVDNYITDEESFGSQGGTGLPPISTPITIEGNNATIQRQVGAPDFRILFVTSTGDLTMNDLSILNGAIMDGNQRGGGIYLNGSSLTLNNVNVENNTADYLGGGIYNDEGTLNITDSSIDFNQATRGGGIQNIAGVIVVDGDSVIANNTAQVIGGGIHSAGGDLTINGGQVRDNQAGSGGGGLFMDGTSTLNFLNLDGVLFDGNTSNGDGGAITLADFGFDIMDSTFINNQALVASGPGGGAIAFQDGASGTIGNNSLFDGNYSQGYGGAISINQLSEGNVSIYDTTIQNNSAEVRGGGIFSNGSILISSTTVSANTALTEEGGGVYSQGELIIQDSTLSDNVSAQWGGGVSAYQSTVTIIGTTIQENQNSASGGGLSSTFSTVDISGGSLIEGNTAQDEGGGIFNGQDSVLTLQESTVSDNQALVPGTSWGGGGIINSHQGSMTITTTTISENTSGYYGGGVVNLGDMWISQSTINDNTATSSGGGIWGINLSLVNTTVSGNHSGNSGGGVFASSNTSIANCTIVHNTTDYWTGGGIYSSPNNTIKNSIIALNTAGALDLSDCAGQSPNVVGENLSSDYDVSCKSDGFSIQADPLIGPLADNSGPTWTHALLPGSPALDVATDCTDTAGIPLSYDQRFAVRPGGPECDIGAYEDSNTFVPPPAPLPIPPSSSTSPCLGILGISLIDGDSLRIQLSTAGLPEEEYSAVVGQYDFICQSYPDYLDRLFCEGPRGEPGTIATLFIYDPSGTPICELTFGIPVPEKPEKPQDPDKPKSCGDYNNETACNADPLCWWDKKAGSCKTR
jgi:predicted outer membrane repeat protein